MFSFAPHAQKLEHIISFITLFVNTFLMLYNKFEHLSRVHI